MVYKSELHKLISAKTIPKGYLPRLSDLCARYFFPLHLCVLYVRNILPKKPYI